MKKVTLSLIGAALMSLTVAHAQADNKVTEWWDDITGSYYQDLNLTEQQKTQLRDIHQKHRLAEEAEVKNVLTPVQQNKWNELKTSRKDSYLDKNEKELQK